MLEYRVACFFDSQCIILDSIPPNVNVNIAGDGKIN